MMRLHIRVALVLLSIFALGTSAYRWGFFGHKRINRLAVYTLPTPLIGFFKQHIQFLTDHAVDPDMRRYATKGEAPRHFIDLDLYGNPPFDKLPRRWTDALAQHVEVVVVTMKGDSLRLITPESMEVSGNNLRLFSRDLRRLVKQDTLIQSYAGWRQLVSNHIIPNYHEEDWSIPADSLSLWFQGIGIELPPLRSVVCFDQLSEHGIIPWHLSWMLRRLTDAFAQKDKARILRYSADFGHYIGDAHVPLHTTSNYNGQKTDQVGIHGFWESRLPELYADAEYDFLVGQAQYIKDPETYFWNIVFDSHRLVDSVLLIEKDLRRTFAPDRVFAFDERANQTIRTYSRAYSKAYHDRLNGMVESRMRATIVAVGSVWLTAWVDAGQPDLNFLKDPTVPSELVKEGQELEQRKQSGRIFGREHED